MNHDEDDKAGPGHPPRLTRFPKGKSGNPKGRPKGSKNLATLLVNAARDQVTANIGGKQRSISKLQATTMQLATKAAGGDLKAMGQFLDWMDEVETRAAKGKPSEYPVSEADLEVIRTVLNRLEITNSENQK